MEFELAEAKIMKTVINALQITDESIHLRNVENGLQFQNNQNQIATDVFLHKSSFSKFNVDKDMDLYFGIKELGTFINLAKNNDRLIISINEEEKNISIQLVSDAMDRRIIIRLLAKDDDITGGREGSLRQKYRYKQFKDRELGTTVDIEANLFADAIKTLNFLGEDDDVAIAHSKAGLTFNGKAGMNKAEVKILESAENVTNNSVTSGPYTFRKKTITLPEVHRANYTFELLRNIPKLYKSGEVISFKMIDNGPMILKSNLPGEMGVISFAITPLTRPDSSRG